MFSSIRSRVIVIVVLVVGSIYFLFPRNATLRERGDEVVRVRGARSGFDLRLRERARRAIRDVIPD